jgi:transposase
VTALQAGLDGKVKIAMEPTGTYGDAIRHQLVQANLPVWMVSPKRTHDSQELFDNVRSMHDPKSAVLVAKLCSMGLATEWVPPPPSRPRLRALVELREHEQRHQEMCFGRMEAMLSRHWPEFGQWMDVRQQRSALRLLMAYPSPSRIAAAPEEAKAFLGEVSRHRLSPQAIDGVVAGARSTLGVPTTAEEERLICAIATQALEVGKRAAQIEHDMDQLARDDAVLAALQRWMGTYTAAVIVTLCDPRQYENARQLEKASGLNLREKSSGEHHGRLSITKRGHGLVRKVLYLFALRMIQESAAVRAWYMRRRGYTEESKVRAVVAVMRKLIRAAFYVAKGIAFDASKLFDLRRLDLEASKKEVSKKVTPRTMPRAIARGTKRARSKVAHASV